MAISFLTQPREAQFGPPQIHRFHEEYSAPCLKAFIFFVNADGGVSISSQIVFENKRATAGHELLDEALRHTTAFVRARWTRIEVATPTNNLYGYVEGGHLRLLAIREARVAACPQDKTGLDPLSS